MSPRFVRRHIGQLLTASFPGTAVPVELRELAREFDIGAVSLFKRNVESPEQVAELSRELADLGADLPAWVSVDQEGGRVARLRAPFTEWPPMITLGRAGQEDLARRFATALGRELSEVGITLDYAPVVDVLTTRTTQAIGDRAFSDDAQEVARLGAVVIRALQAQGVAACAKHFPGHGDTHVDSHETLPVLEAPPDRLDAVEWQPFRAAIEADVAFVMVGHLMVPSLDEVRPASLSEAIVRGRLRDHLRYAGPILTDDLDMGAVSRDRTAAELVIGAIAAGCDGVLICGGDVERQVLALEGLIRATETDAVSVTRIDDALARQRRAKERFLVDVRRRRPDRRAISAIVGCADHQRVADEMAQFR